MSNAIENRDREVLQLHIGSGGIATGHQCWQLYCLEHNLDVDGCTVSDEVPPHSFFSGGKQREKEKYGPRALFLDIDPTNMDEVRNSTWKNFYNNDQFIIANDPSHLPLDTIRKQVEISDHFQGFLVSHSTFGKCAPLTSEIFKYLKEEYSKMIIVTNSLIGSSINASAMSNLLKTADIVIPMENHAILNLCRTRLDIDAPTYSNVNRLIAHCWSHITSSIRFDGCLLGNFEDFQRTAIPDPSLKILSSYLSPLIARKSTEDFYYQCPSVYDMCIPLFNQLDTCFIHQRASHKMVLSVSLLFSGEKIVPKEIGQKLICDMKKWIRFSERIPTGIRCGINYRRLCTFNDQSDILLADKQVLMLTNETSTSKYLCQSVLNEIVRCGNENEEQTEIIETQNYFEELKNNYELIENEIITDNQLDLTVTLPSTAR